MSKVTKLTDLVTNTQEPVVEQAPKTHQIQLVPEELQKHNIFFATPCYGGMLTDFDIPSYWNSKLTIPQYTSPILLPYVHSIANTFNNHTINLYSDVAPTSTLWNNEPYNEVLKQ